MCLTGFLEYFYIFITTMAAVLIVGAVVFVGVLEWLGSRAEKRERIQIDEATGYRDDFI